MELCVIQLLVSAHVRQLQDVFVMQDGLDWTVVFLAVTTNGGSTVPRLASVKMMQSVIQ